MRTLFRRIAPATLLAFALACSPPRTISEPAPAQAPRPRNLVVPLVEHHQHLAGPAAISVFEPGPPPPDVALPAELRELIERREALSAGNKPAEVYTEDVLILDVSEGEDHWVRGRPAAHSMAMDYGSASRFFAKSFGIDGSSAFIAGVVRGPGSADELMHFAFMLRKTTSGWQIATEYATPKPPLEFEEPVSAETVIRVLDDAGIARAVVLSNSYWLAGGAVAAADEYERVRAEHDWMMAEVARHPARLIPFCAVNPLRSYALAELERCAGLPGVRGIKLHFGSSGIDVTNASHVAALQGFFRAANDRKMALVVHLWPGRSYGRRHAEIFLNDILPSAPDVTVQIAHLGGAGRYAHDDAVEVYANAITANDPRMKHVYFDLATVVDETQSAARLELVARRIRQIGVERILFGSDTPGATRVPPLQSWATFRRRIPLTDQELAAIADNVAPYLRTQ